MAVAPPRSEPRDPARRVLQLRAEAQLVRLQLAAQARSTCAGLRAGWQAEAARLSRTGLGSFPDRVVRQARRAADEFEAAVVDRFAELADRAGLAGVEPSGAAAPAALPAAPRGSALEDGLSAVVGAGFGLGVALTAGRLLAELGATPATLTGCGGIGLALSWWVVRARRLLSARTALHRWSGEVASGLRAALEERLLTIEPVLMTAVRTAHFGPGRPGAEPYSRVTEGVTTTLTFCSRTPTVSAGQAERPASGNDVRGRYR